MNRSIRGIALGTILPALAIAFSAPASHADTLGGETWTAGLRVRTVAVETEKGRWDLEARVLDRSDEKTILVQSIRIYTDRPSEFTVQGLDEREYRFFVTARNTALETRLEIHEDGEAIEYVRARYETERRREIAAVDHDYGSNILRVGGRVRAPELIQKTAPRYPEEAKLYRVSGVVVVEALIDESGSVRRTRVVKGLPFGLSEAASEAVASWRFKPATMDGEPVRVAYNVSVEFNLHKSGD
ncbi:MAG: energy transducer TonB [Acidobacteria bacterium]|nr:energy transducer TonB [Acidobacteriota bacterium]